MLSSAPGLVPVGSQPDGALSGKIVYVSGGHGWQFLDGQWTTDRPNLNGMIESFGNQDQITYYADYLLRAGATVVPMRPVGRQVNEVVLDNDSPGVTYSGAWNNSNATPYYDEDYGAVADTASYRFSSISATETATATYTPDIPEAGFYPVYTWVLNSLNRTNQLYRITDSDGGVTEIRVDHRMVGKGWVYLGTYHFDAGTGGNVQISNQSTAGGVVVVADAIRFGNGLGDLPDGPSGIGTGTLSGQPREDEASIFWVWRAVGQGASPSSVVGTSNISAPSRMAEYMNANSNPFGTSVYIGFHSNAGGGRGAVGLLTTSPSLRTPNQEELALYTGRQINQDMQTLDGAFEYTWSTRTTHTYDGKNFGEIDLGPSAEMDATIIEVAFHDVLEDARLLRDPKVRDQIGRSTYEATLEYFVNFGGASNVALPSAPTNVSAVSNESGEVTVSWAAGPSSSGGYNGVYGSPATGFRIYASTNGYGFDGGTFVSGGETTSATLTGYDPTIPYYFKIVAENAGGQSKASEVVTALPSGGGKQVLIVSGFDRFDRTANFQYTSLPPRSTGVSDRVWARYNNSFDYVVQVHAAIDAAEPGLHVSSASNEAVISGAIDLEDYDTVIWILVEESTQDESFDATEQGLVEQFVAGGGNLFVSGSELAWDLDRPGSVPTAADRAFFEDTLLGDYVADNAGTYSVSAAGGGIFAGLSNFQFSDGADFSNLDGQFLNIDFPDVINPQPGAQAALSYVGGSGGNAAIQAAGTAGRGSIVMFGFPFETITTAANRAAVLDRVFDFFGLDAVPPPNADFNGDGMVDAADYTVWRDSLGQSVAPGTLGDADYNGEVEAADYTTWVEQFGTSPPSGAAALGSATADAFITSDAEPAGPVARVAAMASASDRSVVADESVDAGAPMISFRHVRRLDADSIRIDRGFPETRPYFGRLTATIRELAQSRARERLLLLSAGQQNGRVEMPDPPSATHAQVSRSDAEESDDAARGTRLAETPVAILRIQPAD